MIVIGSGPAGVSCAAALLARGCRVTMLDAGVELEAEKKSVLESIKRKWDAAQTSCLRHRIDQNNPVKLSYGSYYPYAEVNRHFKIKSDTNVQCMTSFAKGGLSNVWGGFIERYSAADLSDWPISEIEFAPYYDKVLPMLYGTKEYQSSRQAMVLLENLKKNKNYLDAVGFRFAVAKLAVKFKSKNEQPCTYCGLCQHGCPFDLIYSARHTLDDLLKNSHFVYLKDVIVNSISEFKSHITVVAHDRITREPLIFEGSQVFSACGPIISSKLVLESRGDYNQPVKFLDSTHFMIPCLMLKRVKHVEQESLHTLAQLFLKLYNPQISTKEINLQIYTYMDHYTDKIKEMVGPAYPLLKFFLGPLLDRIIIIQGHLHSNDSHSINMSIEKKTNEIHLEAVLNPHTEATIKLLKKSLSKHYMELGMFPIKGMMKVSKIGKSFHYGGVMPMRINPGVQETDLFGRPYGLKRWHIVDSTIFPSIPAGSITYTVMANAYRIAMETPLFV